MKEDPLMDRIERKDRAETESSAFSRIENLIMESFYRIDPEYRVYVYDIYFRPDRNRLKNSPSAEAERYGYDRRRFVPQLNEALDSAIKDRKTTEILNEIKEIAVKSGIDELIEIFEKEERK